MSSWCLYLHTTYALIGQLEGHYSLVMSTGPLRAYKNKSQDYLKLAAFCRENCSG